MNEAWLAVSVVSRLVVMIVAAWNSMARFGTGLRDELRAEIRVLRDSDLKHLEGRMTASLARVEERLCRSEKRMTASLARVEARLGRTEERMTRSMTRLQERLARSEDRTAVAVRGIRGDLGEMRSELRRTRADLRAGMRSELNSVRAELRSALRN